MRTSSACPSRTRSMSPVHIPRGFTKAYIAGEVVEDLGARSGRPHATFARPRHAAHRGHRPRRRRRGHRPVERGRGLDARRAGGDRQRGRRRPADRRDRPQRVALRARTASRSPGAIVNKVDLDAQPGIATVLERGLARHGIPLLGMLPVPADPLEPDARDDPRGRPRRDDHPGPGPRPGIDGVAIGAMEAGHMLERVGPGTLVIVPGDREDVILR